MDQNAEVHKMLNAYQVSPYHTFFLLYHTISTSSLTNIPLDQVIHADPINRTYVWMLWHTSENSAVISYGRKYAALHLPSLIIASTGFRRTVKNFMVSQELYLVFLHLTGLFC